MASWIRPLAWIVLGWQLGCAADEAPRRKRARAPRPVEQVPSVWDGFATMDQLETAGELRSAHPVGDFIAVVRVNREAAGYGRKGRASLPEGAVVVEALSPEPGQPPSLYYVMRRRAPGYFDAGGDWEYGVAGPDGVFLATGKLRLCARCHAEAAREHLFEPLTRP
jgi:hypothetical protein